MARQTSHALSHARPTYNTHTHRPYSDRLLTGCQLLAALGFFSLGGGIFGALAFLLVLWTTCGTLSVCGIRFTVLVSLLAAASAGILTYAIHRFDQVWELLTVTYNVIPVESMDPAVVDTIVESFTTYSWAAYVTLFSSVCWLFCAMNLLFFLENYKVALVVLPRTDERPHPVKTAMIPAVVKKDNDSYYPHTAYGSSSTASMSQKEYDEYLYDTNESSA